MAAHFDRTWKVILKDELPVYQQSEITLITKTALHILWQTRTNVLNTFSWWINIDKTILKVSKNSKTPNWYEVKMAAICMIIVRFVLGVFFNHHQT